MIVRETIKKSAFSIIRKINEKEYLLMWGRKDVMGKIFKRDSKGNVEFVSNGHPVVESEKETDYCECCHETVKLPKNLANIVEMIADGKKYGYSEPSMDEWAAWAEVFSPEKERLDFLKERLHDKIMSYGDGLYEEYGDNAVNDFTINGEHLWIDKNTRTGLDGRFAAEIAAGKTETTLWSNGKSYKLPLLGDGSAPNMKAALELYASECYDNTQRHVAAKNAMTSIEEVVNYDWTSCYPKKLSF